MGECREIFQPGEVCRDRGGEKGGEAMHDSGGQLVGNKEWVVNGNQRDAKLADKLCGYRILHT